MQTWYSTCYVQAFLDTCFRTCHNMQETKLQCEEKLTADLACVEDFEVEKLALSAFSLRKWCQELQLLVRFKLLWHSPHHA